MSSRTKLDQLNELRVEIVAQSTCPDLALQAKNLVVGDGNPDADIVFIGEAPGKKEDETGLPFMGAAGKFLNAMLESVNLDRNDVYITNIVKYRPPENRDPTKAEKEAFWPYLAKQIDIINPKLVVTLGRHSMNYFLPDAVISDAHGELFHTTINAPGLAPRTQVVVPLFHPAAALYNGRLRQTLLDDFNQLLKHLEDIN